MLIGNSLDQRPLSLEDKSWDSISDYSHTNKFSIKSPDKLKILKSTIRTNTATSDGTVSNFLSMGSKNSKIKNNLTVTSEGSVTGGSLFSTTIRQDKDINSNQSQLKMPSLKQSSSSEKKTINSESRYLKLK